MNMLCISMNARLFFERAGTLLVNLGTPPGVGSAERGRKEASRSTSGAAAFLCFMGSQGNTGSSKIKSPIIIMLYVD